MSLDTLDVREWLRKKDIYDKDIEEALTKQNVKNPEVDFKSYSQEQWNELYRIVRVERFQELKDQTSRNRLDKKCNKLEKEWRTISGIKKTVGKASTGKKETTSKSKEDSEKALKAAPLLKKWMQKNQVWEKDLFEELVEAGVTSEEELKNIDNQDDFDEIIRKVKVARVSELKDQTSRNRLEKKLTKFEKLWREKTGIKKTVQTKNTKKNTKKNKKERKQKEQNKDNKGKALKQWMQKNQVWELELFNELLQNDVFAEDDLVKLDNQDKFDNLVRKVRVQRFTELKDQSSRNRLDKKLTKFEKLWRSKTGIKKTMQKSKKSKN